MPCMAELDADKVRPSSFLEPPQVYAWIRYPSFIFRSRLRGMSEVESRRPRAQ